MRHIYCPIQLI
uniref:Uncharacterized protein n=1 Tax=Rhizophora mucronata TaxID=61149 RepID=A0A2P2NEM2_RHIMU